MTKDWPRKALVPLLLHFSTISWFLGGSYPLGALANFWGTRGRHVGWMLNAVAIVLIGFGIDTPQG